jgi:hypothetical protein
MSSLSLSVLLQKRRQRHRIILFIIAIAATSFLLIPDDSINSFTTMPSRRLDSSLSSSSQEEVQHSSPTTTIITTTTYTDLIRKDVPLPRYNLESTIKAADIYRSRFALLRYDPTADKFIGYYSKKHEWVTGCNKLIESIRVVTILLRHLFPERFTNDSPELVLGVSSGDYPSVNRIYKACIYNDVEQSSSSSSSTSPCDESLRTASPILHFGSVFVNPIFPNIIACPMPGDHLNCFHDWIMKGGQPCSKFAPTPEGYVLPWEELIPQLVWRGTDFRFLQIQNDLSRPTDWNFLDNILQTKSSTVHRGVLTRKLRENYHKMIPRWKGVLYTAESEAVASRTRTLAKINIKFSHVAEGGRHSAIGSKEYKTFEDAGFPVAGEYMNGLQLAKYKYQIDLGGGGGTTWTGTVNKLGMPGLLFHHVTPTKDYIHDHIQPWVHYVPVRSDLEDLLEKLEWAESHPEEAKQISENATELMRKLSSSEGFEPLFQQDLFKPLQEVIEAYTPMNLRDEEAWVEQFEQLGGDSMRAFIECTNKRVCNIIK